MGSRTYRLLDLRDILNFLFLVFKYIIIISNSNV